MGIKKLQHAGDTQPQRAADEALQPPAGDGPVDPGLDSTAEARRAKKPVSPFLSVAKEIVFVLVGALVISFVLRAFVFQLFEIPSRSMENTLQVQDKVVVLKPAEIKRGSVVVFEDPDSWLAPAPTPSPARRALELLGVAPDTSANHLIKRVIGMPGDTVECCSARGNLIVNGVEIDESAYLYNEAGMQVRPSNFPFKVVVPAGHYFMMGDHRNASKDSRCWLRSKGINAFPSDDDMVGPARFIIAPSSRAGAITGEDAFAAVPPPSQPAPAEPVIDASQVTC